MKRSVVVALVATVWLTACRCDAREGVVVPDLAAIADGKTWRIYNGEVATAQEGNRRVAQVKAKGEPGPASNVALALVEGCEFTEGTIEVDLKGKGLRQRSSLGIAFNAVVERSFEAVYFRPFNFKAKDAASLPRAVQYVAWPTYPWEKLRQEQPGRFEAAVCPVPDPDGWFHARFVVSANQVRVFVNGADEPCLVVERLVDRSKGRAGFWVDTHDGAFANLRIEPKG
jgi:hypothetical protein